MHNGDAKLVERGLADLLQVAEPTLPSHHFGTSNVSAASVKASSKRMMSQPMGSSAGNKRPKLMRATNGTTRSTKAATRQVWGGFKQVGRPKSLKRSAFPKLPKQLLVHPRGSACMMGVVTLPTNYSPIATKRSKQRAKEAGRRPNPELFAIDVSAVHLFSPMPLPYPLHIPTAPSEPMARAAYLEAWVPHASTFRQGSQPWHALRAATCTASSIASMLGVVPGDQSKPFSMLFGGEEQQPSNDAFAMQWGVRHEINGVASLLESFDEISASIASKLKYSVPTKVYAKEQGLLFVPRSSPFVQGTVFAAPSAQYAMAASPDALLVGDGGFQALLEVKCACPFTEKDDGRGWVWSPFKRALSDVGINIRHFVQCQVQMAAAQVNPCLLVGWGIDDCKVICVPFDQEWFMQMCTMLSQILLAAAPLAGKRPDMTTMTGHKEFVELTAQRAAAMTELCSIKSVKGPVQSRWL